MNFDIGRLRRSDRIIGISAIAVVHLPVLLQVVRRTAPTRSDRGGQLQQQLQRNGWHTFTNSRWIWLITIIVALGAVAISAGVLELESPVQPGVLVAGLGALSIAA